MNPISRLMGKAKPAASKRFEDLTPEEQEDVLAQQKADRVTFHRESVRNGPVRFSHVTPGDIRRRKARDKAAFERKINRRNRRDFMANQQRLAVLRGKLQTVGALPYITDYSPTTQARLDAGQWLVARFGQRTDEGELVLHDGILAESVEAALEAYRAGNVNLARTAAA